MRVSGPWDLGLFTVPIRAIGGQFPGIWRSDLELEFIDPNRHHTCVDGFEILSSIEEIEVIALQGRIRDLERLRKTYGSGRWRKLKGIAAVRLDDGFECRAELHWYEAHGIGKREMKIKEILD